MTKLSGKITVIKKDVLNLVTNMFNRNKYAQREHSLVFT